MMMFWIIPAVIIGGLVIGTVIFRLTKTPSNTEGDATLPEGSFVERRRYTQPSQKKEVIDSHKFCTNCGVRITDSNNMYCPSCGTPLN